MNLVYSSNPNAKPATLASDDARAALAELQEKRVADLRAAYVARRTADIPPVVIDATPRRSNPIVMMLGYAALWVAAVVIAAYVVGS